MGVPSQAEAPATLSPSDVPAPSSSASAVPNEAPPTYHAPPPMPPPPYFKTHFVNPSNFKSAINEKVNNPLVSLFRLSVRVLQLIFAMASGISYAVEMGYGNVTGDATVSFIFPQVAFSATLLVLVINGVTVRHYRVSWMFDWILTVFWFALFGFFYRVYLGGGMTPEYGEVNPGRMKRAVWCNLINALLWLGSALFSSTMCCSGIKASIKGKFRERRQRKEKRRVGETMSEMEMGTIHT